MLKKRNGSPRPPECNARPPECNARPSECNARPSECNARHPERSEGSPNTSIDPKIGDPSSQAPRDDVRVVNVNALIAKVAEHALARNLRCTVAESCTGGLLAAAMTERPGSSAWFECGFVTYSNQSKHTLLAVASEIIELQGAVSEATALAMVEGALAVSQADIAIAITGIAGPGGGSVAKPVGTVWIAWAGGKAQAQARCYCFTGDRSAIREQAVRMALTGLLDPELSDLTRAS